jgi:type IV pilus assembly protein PilY1
MWGNPVAEMLYESMRYFAGAAAPTARFTNNSSNNGTNEETAMGIRKETWKDPYATNGGFPFCAKPFQTVISDINPSYDGDLPGSLFSNVVKTVSNTPSAIGGFDAAAEGQEIWNQQFGIGSQSVFIGEAGGVTDGAPTPKSASSFGNIRGLSPEEPTKNGTYYAASVARYGHLNDVSAAQNDQKISTYAIALASPLPRFQLGNITIIPFGKTVSGTFGGDARKPTNTIVSLYIEQAVNLNGTTDGDTNGGRPQALFRVSYEDVEQGNDFDMDAIVRYTATQNANGTVTVSVLSEYAAGSANQNLGYIISGTTKDGVYLEVRDSDSGQSTSVYALNTPNGVDAGGCAATGALNSAPCSAGLGLSNTRTFTPSDTTPAIQLENPLWYAAKFGGFVDSNNDKVPQKAEWDANGDNVPDNYFLVTNPLYLRPQLSAAFDKIENSNGSNGSVAVSGAQVRADDTSFAVYPSYSSANNGADWTGDLKAYKLVPKTGQAGDLLWSAAARFPTDVASRKILAAFTPVGPATTRTSAVKDFTYANILAAAPAGGTDRARVLGQVGYTNDQFNNSFGSSMSAESLVSFLRGDRTLQGSVKDSTPYRARSSALGDIIGSNPLIAARSSDYGWASASGLDADLRADYTKYVTAKSGSGKREVSFVGANDGMLHAFDNGGNEVSAFIPNALIGRGQTDGLGYLAQRDYAHRYYVDGKMSLSDIPIASKWQTVLASGIGAGQKGAFGLNVTGLGASSSGQLQATDVLWEINDRTLDGSVADADIGYVMGRPVVVPLENGKWAALFGNGYNSTNGDPALYAVDMATGAVLQKIKPSGWKNLLTELIASLGTLLNGTPPMNGLGNIAVADTNNNGLVDTVYGGDLQGNVWKFKLSNAASNFGTVGANTNSNDNNPLFVAKDPSGNRQPITGGFELSLGPNGGYMLYFGTGRYFVTGDSSTTDVQSLYGIWDTGKAVDNGRGDLIGQQILSDSSTRSVSSYGVNYLTKRGWYLDLAAQDTSGNLIKTGERMTGFPTIESGRIDFPTYAPGVGTDCVPGGTNRTYGLNLLSGAAALGQVTLGPDGTVVGGGSTGAIITGNGAPVQAVSVIRPYVPGGKYCDPSIPSCVADLPPTACTDVQTSPLDPTQSITLQRVCGRQSWRQLR